MFDLWQIIEQILRLNVSGLAELSPLAIFFILFFTTFITEDGACLAAGALAGSGQISFTLALSACFAGIFVGDIGLYWIGRIFGKSFSKTRLFRRLVSERRLERARVWLEKRGPVAIVISRFVSGLRLPTYLAAGFLKTNFTKFAFYFLVATAIWTPILVGSAAFAQTLLTPKYLLLSILSLFVLYKVITSVATWRKRRLLIGRLKRIRNWEFWSLRIFYFPVLLYFLLLAVKHRSLTVFTCANPAILAGGFIGESKSGIYEGLAKSKAAAPFLLKYKFIPKNLSAAEKRSKVLSFMARAELEFPVVLKPDIGERGKDTFIISSVGELAKRIEKIRGDLILQEFAKGKEASIFYYRYPLRPEGKLFSITEKDFPQVKGNGVNTLEELILRDERAVCLARKYFDQNAERLEYIPEKGEELRIIDIGTHSRGAVFKEGGWMKTEALEQRIDEICKGYKGFYFGRFDIRSPSFETLKKGENFKIIELNGVTSESTNIYDKRYSLFDAYDILFKQWKIAFEIGEENLKSGTKKTPIIDLIRLLLGREIPSQKTEKEKAAELCA